MYLGKKEQSVPGKDQKLDQAYSLFLYVMVVFLIKAMVGHDLEVWKES